MRAISIACGVALAAVFLLEAMLILTTGRVFVFTTGTGGPHFEVWTLRAAVTCLISFAVMTGLWVAARANPRRYFQIMWWRDVALLVTALSAVVAAVSIVASQVAYGTL